MKKVIKKVILGIVENQKHEILLTQRFEPDIPDAHLKWDIIGGSQEKDEGKEETVTRECLEETGYKIKVIRLLPKNITQEWKHKDFIVHVDLQCFYCRYISGEILLRDPKIACIEWVSEGTIFDFNLLKTTAEFLHIFFKNT